MRIPTNNQAEKSPLRFRSARPRISADNPGSIDNLDLTQVSHHRSGLKVEALLAETAKEATLLASKLPEHVEGEVLVKLKGDFAHTSPATMQTLNGFAEEYGGRVLQKFNIPDNMLKSFNGELVRLKLPPGIKAAEAIAAMSEDERVEYAATNDIIRTVPIAGNDNDAAAAAHDGLSPKLWGLNNEGQTGGTPDADIDATEAWSIQTGNGDADGPLIAIIDTGINYHHEALQANVWTNPGEIAGNGIDDDGNGVVDDIHGVNAATDTGDPLDDDGHGSHCFGTIAGSGEGAQGLYGVMHDAQVLGAKFLAADGSGTLADAIESVLYSTKMGARITSNSWGGGGFNRALYDAFKSSPAMHIVAAGNERNNNDSNPAYPANFDLPNVISVAASDHDDDIAGFSNYGLNTVDLAAPGVEIFSATAGGSSDYKTLSGTSMATPHVSGVAGLIVSQFPEISNQDLKARLLNSVDRKSQLSGKMVTGGRLNVFSALEVDKVPPGTPEQLRVVEASAGRVTLGFTATGDDGELGRASAYVLKVSDRPIVDGKASKGQVSFDDAKNLPTPVPGEPGGAERITAKTRLSGQEQRLYFALKVRDNIGNLSDMKSTHADLPPAKVAFEDNVNGPTSPFTGEDTWARVDVEGRGKVWTDSPEGRYKPNSNTSLTSQTMSLANLKNSTLIFDAKMELEPNFDLVHVEVAQDRADSGKLRWRRLAKLNGVSDWATNEVDLSAYDGKSIKVRFRLTSDSSRSRDGIYLDNFLVAGGEA